MPVIQASATQRPAAPQTIFQEVDAVDPPSTLAEFVAQSDAVAHVQILQSRTYLAPNGSVLTEHTARLVEPVKSHQRLGAASTVITIVQRAGRFDAGDHVIEVKDQPLFESAEEFVLFLRWNPTLGAFEVRNGPHGAFRVTAGGGLEPKSHSQLAQSVKDVDAQRFIATIRTLGLTRR
jgi:hypothetical protein